MSISPLYGSIKRGAKKKVIQGSNLFSVIEHQDAQGNVLRVHTPLAFTQLKELKNAGSQYGQKTSFIQAVLETIAVEALPPVDWKHFTRAWLSGGDYVLWNHNSMSM